MREVRGEWGERKTLAFQMEKTEAFPGKGAQGEPYPQTRIETDSCQT